MAGRKAGGTNDPVTNRIREAMRRIVDNNLDNFDRWIARIEEKDPIQAAKLIVEMAEFSLPKIARTELQPLDGDGKPASSSVTIQIVGIEPKK